MRLVIQLGVFALRVYSTRAYRVNNFDEIRIARRRCVDCKTRQKHELTSYRVGSHSHVIDLWRPGALICCFNCFWASFAIKKWSWLEIFISTLGTRGFSLVRREFLVLAAGTQGNLLEKYLTKNIEEIWANSFKIRAIENPDKRAIIVGTSHFSDEFV